MAPSPSKSRAKKAAAAGGGPTGVANATSPLTATPKSAQTPALASTRSAGKQAIKPRAKAHAHPATATAATATATATSAASTSTTAAHIPSSSTLPWSAVINADVGSLPVVFSSDGDFYFTTSGSSIRIHSRQTGLIVSTLSSPSSGPTRHTAPVSSIFLNPCNALQLVTASLDGTVKIWDYLDARLLKSVFVGLPIQYAAMHAKHPSSVYVAVRKPKAQPNGEHVDPFNYDGRTNSIIYSASLSTVANSRGHSNPHLLKPRDLLRIGKTRDASGLEISPDGQWMVLIGNRKVQIASLSSTGLRQGFTKFTTDAALTALAFHPDPENATFATGDVKGKIRVWYFLRGEDGSGLERVRMQSTGAEKRAPSTLLHWHAHAVSSLRFSPLGSHLISGGEEGVLVLWQLASQTKEFVPRLGAPIASVAMASGTEFSDGEIVVRLADGSTCFISAASLKVTKTFSGSKIDVTRRQLQPHRLWKVEQPLAIQPSTGHLVVTSSHPSTLQFVDVAADRLIREVEVTPSNRVSRPDETPLEPTRVERVDFFANSKGRAEWMATLDSRRSTSQGRNEVTQHLKFWKWEPKSERYVLNTRVEAPHDGPLVAMRFSPRTVDLPTSGAGGEAIVSPLLVTAGLDGQIKVWRIATSSVKGGRTSSYWIVRSSFGYRDSIPSDVDWSPDASLLAVAQGTFVTLWDTRSNVLRRLVCAPSTAAPRTSTSNTSSANEELNPNESRHIVFGGKGGRFLFMSSSKALCAWDLVLGQMAWEKTLGQGHGEAIVRNSRLVRRGEEVLVVSTLESKRQFGGSEVTSTNGHLKRSQEAKRSRIELFDPAHSTAKRVWNVPLAIREVRVVDLEMGGGAWKEESKERSEDPTLLAITESHDVILLGTAFGYASSTRASQEDVGSSPSQSGANAQRRMAGDSAQSLSGISIARRTLFDELFATPSSSYEGAESGAVVGGRGYKGASTKGLAGLFEAPAHLLPPLETLFGEFVDRILPPRPGRREVGGEAKEAKDVKDGEKEEEDDEVKELEKEELRRERREREEALSEMQRVDAWEVEELVRLFDDVDVRKANLNVHGDGNGVGDVINATTRTTTTSTPKPKIKQAPKLNGSVPSSGGTPKSTPRNPSKPSPKGESPTVTPKEKEKGGRKRKGLPS